MEIFRRTIILIYSIIVPICVYSQGYNDEITTIANFAKRMYNAAPFEGVKVIKDYDHNFFISLLSLEKTKYTNLSVMNRVAQVKSRQQASTFFNGSIVTSDLVIKTTEVKESQNSNSTVEMIESIKESSFGFVEGMELLINFDTDEGKRMVFIFYREIKAKK